MGIFIKNYIPGKPVYMRYGHPRNHEDVQFRNSYGDLVMIHREYAEDPEVSYAVVPYRVASSADRTAFAKNFVIVDKSLSTIDYLSIPSIDVGSDARFIPIRAESLIDNNLLFAINSL